MLPQMRQLTTSTAGKHALHLLAVSTRLLTASAVTATVPAYEEPVGACCTAGKRGVSKVQQARLLKRHTGAHLDVPLAVLLGAGRVHLLAALWAGSGRKLSPGGGACSSTCSARPAPPASTQCSYRTAPCLLCHPCPMQSDRRRHGWQPATEACCPEEHLCRPG